MRKRRAKNSPGSDSTDGSKSKSARVQAQRMLSIGRNSPRHMPALLIGAGGVRVGYWRTDDRTLETTLKEVGLHERKEGCRLAQRGIGLYSRDEGQAGRRKAAPHRFSNSGCMHARFLS